MRMSVADRLAESRKAAMECDCRVEKAVGTQTLRDAVDAEVGGEEKIGLTGLDGDADRGATAVEVPGVGEDVVLGDDAAAGHRAFDAFDFHYAINQHERLIREADARGVRVNFGEVGAEDVGDGAAGEFQT